MMGYEPIRDASDTVIGIYYVGYALKLGGAPKHFLGASGIDNAPSFALRRRRGRNRFLRFTLA
jgi:hypothetical protein